MTSKRIHRISGGGFLGILRSAALIALLAGAVGSVALTLYAGRRNASQLLMVLFVLWVLSPFVTLLWADVVSRRWTVLTRSTLYSVMLVLALGSPAIYGVNAFKPPKAQAAFVFVVVPLASWLLIAVVVPAAALISGKLLRRGESATVAE